MGKILPSIQTARDTINPSFDMTISQMQELYHDSNGDGYSLLSNAFVFGYQQGYRAAQAEYKKATPLCTCQKKKDTAVPNYRVDLLEVESIVCYAHQLCDGLYPASCQMDDKQFVQASAGALHMLSIALDKAHSILVNMPLDN